MHSSEQIWTEGKKSLGGERLVLAPAAYLLSGESSARSMERDQGAKEEGMGVRVRDLHDGS